MQESEHTVWERASTVAECYPCSRALTHGTHTRYRYTDHSLLFSIPAPPTFRPISRSYFSISEKENGWTFVNALYFVITSLTTIGLGDFFPTSLPGYYFLVPFCVIGLGLLAVVVTLMEDWYGCLANILFRSLSLSFNRSFTYTLHLHSLTHICSRSSPNIA